MAGSGSDVLVVVVVLGLGISLGQPIGDPCDTHHILNDEWRNPEFNEAPTHCDNMTEGWYAFNIGKDPAIIPTQCLQDNTCGARVPLHVQFEAQTHPSMQVGENVTAWLCGSFNVLGAVDCCVQRQPVTIKRCQTDLFVYLLRPQRVCPVAVCAVRWGSNTNPIPEQFVAKPGDTPRSLLPPPTAPFPEICPEGQHLCPDGSCAPCPDTDLPAPLAQTTARTTFREIIRPLVTEVHNANPAPLTTISTDLLPVDNSSAVSASSVPVSPVDSNPTSSANSSSANRSRGSGAGDSSMNATRENVTVSVPDGAQPSVAGVSHMTSTPGDEDMRLPAENVTTRHNASDAKPDASPADVVTTKPSPDGLGTTLTVFNTGSEENFKTSPVTAPTPGSPASSAEGVADPGGITASLQVSTGFPASPPTVLSDDAVRFVLNGTYEEAEFRDALLSFVNNVSEMLTDGEVEQGGLHNMTLRSQTSLSSNITLVDVLVADPATNGSIPAQRFVTIIQNDNFAEHLLSQAGQTLIKVCPTVERCDGDDTGPTEVDRPRSQSLFDRNRGVFIAVIALAAVSLLVLLLGLLFVRYRRRGVWVLAPDHEEKGADLMSVENPMTDRQILDGEQERVSETTLTVNGDHRYASAGSAADEHNDIPAADEDNGWVVPLEQAPTTQGLAEKTEDTQF